MLTSWEGKLESLKLRLWSAKEKFGERFWPMKFDLWNSLFLLLSPKISEFSGACYRDVINLRLYHMRDCIVRVDYMYMCTHLRQLKFQSMLYPSFKASYFSNTEKSSHVSFDHENFVEMEAISKNSADSQVLLVFERMSSLYKVYSKV